MKAISSISTWVKSVLGSVKTTIFIIVFFAVLVIVAYRSIVQFLFPAGDTESLSANFETLKFIAYVGGVALLVWQIVLTNRRTKATEETARASTETSKAAIRNAEATLRNLKLIEKGQVQERFKNAIDQLGHENDAVNLGAIYTMHHIARDCTDLRKSIFDILCSYIRETTSGEAYRAKLNPAIKVQSILNLLFVDESEREIYSTYQADLHDSFMMKMILRQSNLARAKLYFANLEEAILMEANLEGSNLRYANLKKAFLVDANLKESQLSEAHLEGALLKEANLERADLKNSYLQGADLSNAHLEGADLKFAHLEGAIVLESDWIMKLEEKGCIGFQYVQNNYMLVKNRRRGANNFWIRKKT